MDIPVSKKQVLGYFKEIGAKSRQVAAPCLATKRSRMITAAAVATLFAVLAVINRPQVSDVPLQGLVLEIEAQNILSEESGLPHTRVLVAVGDTTETQLLLPPPVPEIGHFIPLIEGHTWNGEPRYTLDREKWQIDGPS